MEYYISAPEGKAMSGEGQKSLDRILALRGVEIIQREFFSAIIRYAGSDFEIRRLTEPIDVAIVLRSVHDEAVRSMQAKQFLDKTEEDRRGYHLHGEF